MTTFAPDEAGLQGIFLSHRPPVGLGEELLGGLGALEPSIVQLEVVGDQDFKSLLGPVRWPVPPPIPGSGSAGAPGCLRRSVRRAIRSRRPRRRPERHGCWSARSLVVCVVGCVVGRRSGSACASLNSEMRCLPGPGRQVILTRRPSALGLQVVGVGVAGPRHPGVSEESSAHLPLAPGSGMAA